MGLGPHKEPLTAARFSLQLFPTAPAHIPQVGWGRQARGVALRGAGGPLPPLLLGPYTCEEKTGILQNSCLPWVEHAAFPAVRQKGVASGLLFQCSCHPTAEMATPSLLNFVLCLWFCLPLFLSVDVFVVSPPHPPCIL